MEKCVANPFVDHRQFPQYAIQHIFVLVGIFYSSFALRSLKAIQEFPIHMFYHAYPLYFISRQQKDEEEEDEQSGKKGE